MDYIQFLKSKEIADQDSGFNVKELKGSLERSEIFSDESDTDGMVELAISNGKMECHSGCETEWITEDHDVEYAGEDIKIRINPRYLYQILDRMDQFTLSENRILFRCGEFQHVIALVA